MSRRHRRTRHRKGPSPWALPPEPPAPPFPPFPPAPPTPPGPETLEVWPPPPPITAVATPATRLENLRKSKAKSRRRLPPFAPLPPSPPLVLCSASAAPRVGTAEKVTGVPDLPSPAAGVVRSRMGLALPPAQAKSWSPPEAAIAASRRSVGNRDIKQADRGTRLPTNTPPPRPAPPPPSPRPLPPWAIVSSRVRLSNRYLARDNGDAAADASTVNRPASIAEDREGYPGRQIDRVKPDARAARDDCIVQDTGGQRDRVIAGSG